MPGPSLVQRQVDALKELARLAVERATRETKTEAEFAKDKAAAERQYQSARQGIVRRRDMQVQEIEGAIGTTRASLDQAYQAAIASAKTERDQKIAHSKKRFQVESEAADTALEEAGWETGAVFDANLDKVNKKTEQFKRRLEESLIAFDEVKAAAAVYVDTYKKYIVVDPDRPPPEIAEAEGPIPKLDEAVHRIAENYLGATKLKILPIVKLDFFIFLCVVLFLALAIGLGLLVGWTIGPIAALAITLVAGFLARQSIVAIARKQLTAAAAPMAMALSDAEHLADRSADWVQENAKRLKLEVERRRDAQNKKQADHHDRLVPELEQRRDADLKAAEERYPKALAEAAKKYESDLSAAEEKYKKDLAEAKADGERDLQELDARYFAEVEARQAAYEAAWKKLIDDWRDAIGRARSELDAVNAEGDRMFLPWHDPAWDPWKPPVESPPVLRFGEVKVPLKQIPQGVPEDPRLKELTPEAFTLPAFLQFPDKISLLIKASDEGRGPAVQLLQATMLRFLTAIPPGKVRFTIVDPVGLGQNFSTFMNLKDVDELLVNSRIWTESTQIDQRLLDLTEHMENVIQTYLRNEYNSIEEYNVMAGEVAEPYRILVAANYPANFSDSAQRRLVSIAQSGPRCGVYVLVSLDPKLQNATNQLAKDLEPNCVNLTWKENRFLWKDSPFEQYPLRLDVPPEDSELNRIVKLAGDAAKAAKRVEVPFEVIAPSHDKYWTWDSRSIVDVPLGRAGATKFQALKLGKGTSQHVLIAGKTGSGKSTLLHAMITNAALMYSPKELELYLIDFKKGVEFKTYAAYSLPHARVIAVESEREFGLSVLQRLDVELKKRGDLYREAGAQDVASYRRITGNDLPRNPAPGRRVPGVLHRGRQALAGIFAVARPPGPPRAGLRRPRHARLADPRRRLLAGPDHDRADGHPDRLAVLRGRLAPDPQRGQRRRPPPDPPRRGDLQRRQRDDRGEPHLPGRVPHRHPPRGVPQGAPRPGDREGHDARHPPARLRGEPAGRHRPEPAAQRGPGRPRLGGRGPGRDRLGRRRDRDQGPDQRRLPPPGRQPRPHHRPAGRGRARHPDDDARQPRHPAGRPRPDRRGPQRREVLRLRRLGARLAQPRHAQQAWPTSSRTRSRRPTTATSAP